MLPFLPGKKPKTLKWPTRLHIIYSPLPTLLTLFLITSCLCHTPRSRAGLATYWSLHTTRASSLRHCAVPSSALNSHDSSLPFLESLLKTHLLHEGLALPYLNCNYPHTASSLFPDTIPPHNTYAFLFYRNVWLL